MSPRVKSKSVLGLIWGPVVALVVISLATVSIWKIHDSSRPTGPIVSAGVAKRAERTTQKHVTYELFGSAGGKVTISYLDIDGKPIAAVATALPWSHTETTLLSSMAATLMAQANGSQLGCRITVDGVVRDEKSDTHQGAAVVCKVKSA